MQPHLSLDDIETARAALDSVPEPARSQLAALVDLGLAELGRRIAWRHRQRAGLLVALASHFPGLTPWPRAEAVAAAWSAYYTRTWPRTRAASSCPHAAGSQPATCWALCRLDGRPLKARQVSAILGVEIAEAS